MNSASQISVSMLVTNAFRPDPRVLKEAASLAVLGYRITIIAWDRQAEYPQHQEIGPSFEVLRIQNAPSSYGVGARQLLPLMRFWQAAAHLLDKLQPDLLHCHDFDTLPLGLYWGRRHHRPVIYDAHEYYADLVAPRLHGIVGKTLFTAIQNAERWSAGRASAVITVDKQLAAYYRSVNRRVIVVGHYPRRGFVKSPAPVFQNNALNLIYHGRLSADRGLLTYLEILRGLLEAGIPAHLHLAGTFTPQSEKNIFINSAADLQAAIIDHGWVPFDQMPGILSQADVGLALLQPLPRYVAAQPVKLFEYMAAGLPVLASDFPPIRQVVIDSACGQVIDPTTPQEAIQILKTWWQSPEIPRQLGQQGYQSVQNKYNWELLVERLAELYQTLF